MNTKNQFALAQEMLMNSMNLIDNTTAFLEIPYKNELDDLSMQLYRIYKKIEKDYKELD